MARPTLPPDRNVGDAGHVTDSNTVKNAVAELFVEHMVGSGSPVGSVTPANGPGTTYADTSGGPLWVAYGSTNADWVNAVAGSNLLTPNQASGTDTLGTTAGLYAINSTLASHSAEALQGSRCIEVTYVGANPRVDMGTTSGASANGTIPVTGGQTYTVSAWVKTTSGATNTAVAQVYWYTAGGASLGSNTSSSLPLSASWSERNVVAVAPATAAFAAIRVFAGISSGQTFLVDKIAFYAGAGGEWRMPGEPIPALTVPPSAIYHPARLARVPDAATGDLGLPGYAGSDTGWRNVSADLMNGFTGTLHVRRIGQVVHYRMRPLTAPGGQFNFYTPPAGFAHDSGYESVGIGYGSAGAGRFDLNGSLILLRSLTGSAALTGDVYGTASVPLGSTWPTSLPGTQVTPPATWT